MCRLCQTQNKAVVVASLDTIHNISTVLQFILCRHPAIHQTTSLQLHRRRWLCLQWCIASVFWTCCGVCLSSRGGDSGRNFNYCCKCRLVAFLCCFHVAAFWCEMDELGEGHRVCSLCHRVVISQREVHTSWSRLVHQCWKRERSYQRMQLQNFKWSYLVSDKCLLRFDWSEGMYRLCYNYIINFVICRKNVINIIACLRIRK